MDKCQFSEFSYGYCLTEDLIVGQDTTLTAAPVFPSLIEEGQQGVGYDVRLDRPGIPLFLQFKLVHQMVRGTANEAKKGHFQVPFYRMHLRSSANQHQSLLSLEQAGNAVFYVAPGFHTIADLDAAYKEHQVWNRSFRIRPISIGPIFDDEAHHVTFEQPTESWRLYSQVPSKAGRAPTTDEIAASLLHKIAEHGERNLRQQIEHLDAGFFEIVNAQNRERKSRERIDIRGLEEIDALRRVAYVARQFFDCQMLFVTRR